MQIRCLIFSISSMLLILLSQVCFAGDRDYITTKLNSVKSGYPVGVAIDTLTDDGYIAAYSINNDVGGGIYHRRYNSSMQSVGSEVLLLETGFTGANGTALAVKGLAGGGFVTAVENRSVYVNAVDGSLIKTINKSCFSSPSLSAKKNGSFVVAWRCGASNYLQEFTSTGENIGEAVEIAGDIYGGGVMGGAPKIAVLLDNSVVVVWDNFYLDENGFQSLVMSKKFDTQSVPVTSAQRVNSSDVASLSSVASLADGGYVVAWNSDSRILTQRFDQSGTPVGSEVIVNSITSGDWLPGLAGTPDGGYLVVWQSSSSVAGTSFTSFDQYFRRFDSLNNTFFQESVFNSIRSLCNGCPGYAAFPSIALSSTGKGAAIYPSHDGTVGWDVYAVQSNFDGNTVDISPVALEPVTLGSQSLTKIGSFSTRNAVLLPADPHALLTAKKATGYPNSNWLSGCDTISSNVCSARLTPGKSIKARFIGIDYALTVSKSGSGKVVSNVGGIDCGASCSANFNYLENLILTAVPDDGSYLDSWVGCTNFRSNKCYVSMGNRNTITAKFTKIAKYSLNVSSSGGVGLVTSLPKGINCGNACSQVFKKGTGVTLNASSGAGYKFVGWTGACSGTSSCKIVVNSELKLNAIFKKVSLYNVSINLSGSGAVSSKPTGINCGAICSYKFIESGTVTLTAKPAKNKKFNGWGGGCGGKSLTCRLTVKDNISVSASFSN